MSDAVGTVSVTARGCALQVTIDNPPLNVLTLDVIGQLSAALADVSASEQPVLLLRAAGDRAFCAGVDVAAHAPEHVDRMLGAFHGFLDELLTQDKLVVAIVEGDALGGGFELITLCDLVIAAEHARFGQPEVDVGCFAPVAAAVLPRSIGHQLASEIMYLGRPLDAARAAEMGLVNWTDPASDVERRVDWLLETIGSKSAVVLREMRRAMLTGRREALRRRLTQTERIYRDNLAATSDMAEGVRAFMEKRPPEWRHR